MTEQEGPKSPDGGGKQRVVLSETELSGLAQNELVDRWKRQDIYVSGLEEKLGQQEGDIADLRQTLEKAQLQLSESQQREKVLVRRLAAKEQESQDLVVSKRFRKRWSGSNVHDRKWFIFTV
uniref:BMERB domain-containing protein n=1 Tax=Photinus pyralis TaxID=7054 RepID=A0A1Y1M7G6_PHOPY